MKGIIVLIAAVLTVGLLSGQTLAGDGGTGAGNFTREQLIGLEVENLQGHHVGIIRDVSMNEATGELYYVILGKSLLGIGEDTRVAVPLEALQIERSGMDLTATLIVSEPLLLGGPSITAGESEDDFTNRLQDYYCASPEIGSGVIGLKQC